MLLRMIELLDPLLRIGVLHLGVGFHHVWDGIGSGHVSEGRWTVIGILLWLLFLLLHSLGSRTSCLGIGKWRYWSIDHLVLHHHT
jgi:hypothetical protein